MDDESSTVDEVASVKTLTPFMKAVCILFYSVLCVCCIYGNVLVILVIMYFKRLRTATNILILNLAVADLFIAVFCIPFSYWQVLIFDDQRWLFGSVMCSLLAFLQAMSVFLSAWTLVAISFDRWMAIMFVLSPSIRLTMRKAIYLVSATWVFSILMALPLLFTTRSFLVDGGIEHCGEDWTYFGDSGVQVRKVYSSMVVILQYIVPQAVLIITYTHIGMKMWNSRVPGMQNGATSKMIVDRHESVKKLVPMVILISALFALCWLPLLLLINVIQEVYPEINSYEYILYLWWFAHGLAMLHSIVNPVVYYVRNAKFREGFSFFSSKLIPCIKFKEFHFLNDNNSRSFRNRSRYSGVVNPASSDDSTVSHTIRELPLFYLISHSFLFFVSSFIFRFSTNPKSAARDFWFRLLEGEGDFARKSTIGTPPPPTLILQTDTDDTGFGKPDSHPLWSFDAIPTKLPSRGLPSYHKVSINENR
ncbi:unnamed protein product [Caenorhabditis bovis]|uniref:G-protein coupled receptors family 1 profile domain-containing protein n=1 Tax=Caenorhabditis bovis TaxID=2654633 RepID=A0A8S1F6M4_9PELO|nr:unnamed protein product [Caenorhabditis bovis]